MQDNDNEVSIASKNILDSFVISDSGSALLHYISLRSGLEIYLLGSINRVYCKHGVFMVFNYPPFKWVGRNFGLAKL